MKNKLVDLNNHLFEQLERLNDDELTQDEISKEVTRTDAMVKVSEQIISNANLAVRSAELVAEYGGKNFEGLLPAMMNGQPALEDKTEGKKR